MFNTNRKVAIGLGHIGLDGGRVTARHESALALLDYWAGKADSGGTVAWGAVQPNQIVSLLPNLFLAEPTGADWRYRLFGTAVSARFGLDFTRKCVSQIYEPSTAQAAAKLYRKVATCDEPRIFGGRYLGLALEHVVVEVPHLPVRGRDGETWIFGGVFFWDEQSTPGSPTRH